MIPISHPSPRVSQLDAGLLDDELISLLKEQVSKIFQLHSSKWWSYNQNPELWTLLLNIVVYKLTVLKTGASYGSSLQNLKLADSRTGTVIGKYKRWILLALIVGHYGYDKLVSKIFSTEGSEIKKVDNGSIYDKVKAYAIANRTTIITKLNNCVKTLNLLNFITFLINGRYPSLVHRILKISFRPIVSDLLKFNGDNISYEFQNRQLVWNVMTEFLVFIFPLFQLSKIRKIVRSILTTNKDKIPEKNKPVNTSYTNLPTSQCAICLEEKNRHLPGSQNKESCFITNPYTTNCGHIFCYICILTRFNAKENSDDFENCPRCGVTLEWFQEYGRQEDIDETAILVSLEETPLDSEEQKGYPIDQLSDSEEQTSANTDESDSNTSLSEEEEYEIDETM